MRQTLPLSEPDSENELPFLIFGQMVLAQMVDDFDASEAAASRLIDAESAVRADDSINFYVENGDFLFGLTNYNQLHGDWHKSAKRLTNPNPHEDTQLVIEAILQNLYCAERRR